MIKLMRLALVFIAVVGMAGVVLPAYGQEKVEQNATSISGEIVSVDLVKSEVVVKQLKDAVSSTYINTTFSIAPETKILKEDSALKLPDLKAGDKVTVKYVIDAAGKQKVESVSVENKEVAVVK